MSNPFREPPDGLVLVLTILLGVPSAVLFAVTGQARWVFLAVLALAVMVGQAAFHDRRHRSRGERTHALWGLNGKPGFRSRR